MIIRDSGAQAFILNNDENFLRDANYRLLTKEKWEEMKVRLDSFYDEYSEEEIHEINNEIKNFQREEYGDLFLDDEEYKKSEGFIYFVQADGNYYKIGRTTNLNSRIKSLKTSSPNDLELIGYIETDCTVELEESFHEYFESVNVNGEWFDINLKSVKEACKDMSIENLVVI